MLKGRRGASQQRTLQWADIPPWSRSEVSSLIFSSQLELGGEGPAVPGAAGGQTCAGAPVSSTGYSESGEAI